MVMDQHSFELTRRALHAVAELVIAGPQYAESGDIRLTVTPGGFGAVTAPDARVDGVELVTPSMRVPIQGTSAELARAVGLTARSLDDVYSDGAGVSVDEPIVVEPEAAGVIADAFARGDAAMRAFAPDEEPVLWPEHFDIGISLDQVNYGVSPGDAHVVEPYAYVGPWTRKEGAFWNMPFGAALPMRKLPDADAVEQFFRKGAKLAVSDPDST